MAFIERLPALVEPMPGVPDTWRARLEDGKPVAVRRYHEADPDRVTDAMGRVRTLAGIRHPRLVAPLGGAADADGVSVIYPAELGTGLDRALQSALGPGAGLALAEDLLEGLAALHRAGLVHGALGEPAVGLFPDGHASLWAARPDAEGGQPARAEDVRAAAQLVCRAMGLPVEWTPSDPLRDVERSAPALAATLRALAGGTLALDAQGALGALREAAGGLAADASAGAAREKLAQLAGARRPPAVPDAAARAPRRPAASELLAPLEARARRWLPFAGVVVAAMLVLAGAGYLSFRLLSRPGETAPPTAIASPLASPQPSAAPSPSAPPSSSGDVKSVAERALGSCALGSACTIEVEVFFVPSQTGQEVAWQFELVDSCTGDATYLDGNDIQAKSGWTHVIGDHRVSLPGPHPLSVIAVTTTPSQAASSPLLVSGGSC